MEIPSLETLLADYAIWNASVPNSIPLTPSSTTPGELARIETALHIALPTDYRTMALHYNLAALEFNFSRFYPPVLRPMALFDAFDTLLDDKSPFGEEYRRWGVAPVGEDGWNNILALATRHPTEPRAGEAHQPSHPFALVRPYGSVWAFYPDEMRPSMRYVFEFVSSGFSKALHMALLCWRKSEYFEAKSALAQSVDLIESLATIDPAIHSAPYWQRWIELAQR